MRSTAAACSLGAWIFLAAATTAAQRMPIIWHDDLKMASHEARALERPILLYFTGKWCPACLRVERTAFMDRRVIDYITGHLVAVRIDADGSPELAESWNVDRLPTALILGRDGRVQGRIEGYRPAESYLSELESLARAGQRKEPQSDQLTPVRSTHHVASVQPSSPEPAADETIELAARTEKPASNGGVAIRLELQQEPNLALNGICVVTLLRDHKVVTGDPQFSLEFEGATYWFAASEKSERFHTNPKHYAPILSGLCVTSLVDDSCEVPGSMRCAAVYNDRLYLFAGPEQRRRFQANPKRYAGAAATVAKG
jgi:YHS domain-containing protein/thioredoxin-related protein